MTVAAVDTINFWLLLAAFVVAYLVPFELLLVSYAFLGPLHYLTEISWLHDRNYFTVLPQDKWLLTGASVVLVWFGAALVPSASELVWLLLALAFCAAFVRSWPQRLLILATSLLLLWPFIGSSASVAVSLLIPTVVHVYIFTLLFMFFGALRGNSRLGLINSFLFLIGSLVLILLPQSSLQLWPDYVAQHYVFFSGVADAFATLLPFSSAVVLPAIASFLAFTYTYHYLNWFSKTSVIPWHDITPRRALFLGVCYGLAVGFYLYDYTLGFMLLITLSFLHVVLEFPLNFKTAQGLYKQLRTRR